VKLRNGISFPHNCHEEANIIPELVVQFLLKFYASVLSQSGILSKASGEVSLSPASKRRHTKTPRAGDSDGVTDQSQQVSYSDHRTRDEGILLVRSCEDGEAHAIVISTLTPERLFQHVWVRLLQVSGQAESDRADRKR
jgi:hypothetical protein